MAGVITISWTAAVVFALVVLSFCGYELSWKIKRFRRDLRRLYALQQRAQALQAEAQATATRSEATAAALARARVRDRRPASR